MKTSHRTLLAGLAALLPLAALAQVNSGSDGHDGALNPTANLVIDMADHPDGIYHYTSVNIPPGVTVSFIPNAGNKPVVWLVQDNCSIDGTVDVSGKVGFESAGGAGGPGGWSGGNGGATASVGKGPGGGGISPGGGYLYGGSGSFSTLAYSQTGQGSPGQIYGNAFCLPLLGGSGGGGSSTGGGSGGGGGGGAILIAANAVIEINGALLAQGNASGLALWAGSYYSFGGGGSGGGIRLIATEVRGGGQILASSLQGYPNPGLGRIRIDSFAYNFGGIAAATLTRGFQPIILPAPGQGIQLGIQSVGGVAVAANPSGVLANPDVIIPAQQTNPVSVVVNCTNVPLNSEITVVVHPANGPDVQAVGLNNIGTAAASTAALSLNMPRGGGIIYAKAVTGIAGTASTGTGDAAHIAQTDAPADPKPSLAETGWTATGERFKAIEVTAMLGGPQRIAYITESGKRYEAN